ncbi:MAG: molybdopterin-synthase adenylyltransferase MoeB [Chloroflexota bacterium]
MSSELSHDEILHYSRHILLPDVGKEGQKKIKDASVLIIGTGGLGSPVSMYLAAAGIGKIGLVDYDVVDYSNLQRQIVHGISTIDTLKVESARTRLLDLNPAIDVIPYNDTFNAANARQIAEKYDIIVDCSDNFPTRYLTNDLCVFMGKPYIYGAIFRFDGQVSVFDARRGPCYRCLFPEPPPPGSVPSCGASGVFGVLPGTIGTLQATEVIKNILGIGETLIGRLLLYSALDMTFNSVRLRKNPSCKVCGEYPEITELIDYDAFCGISSNSENTDFDIEPHELAERLQRGDSILLIDVREPQELEISRIENAENVPLGQFSAHTNRFDRDKEIVIFCKGGTRSMIALYQLHASGFKHLRNLRGGINAWAREVDPNLPVY